MVPTHRIPNIRSTAGPPIRRSAGPPIRSTAGPLIVFVILPLLFAPSCARKNAGVDLKLKESIYGFYPGETKKEVFKRAQGVVTITRAPEPPAGYRGELWYFSAPLEPHREVDYVRLAFFQNRLWEIVVYFRDTSAEHLNRLKLELEEKYHAHAVAPDGTIEMAYKTYRLPGPGISITLRRITKQEGTELYVQYFHDELLRQLIERNKAAEKK